MKQEFIEDNLIILSKQTFDVFLKEEHPSDLIGLYTFYYYTAKWQKTNQIKCTTSYVAKGLNWTKERVIRNKKKLIEIGLIQDLRRKNEKGQIEGWYIKLNYIWKKETVKGSLKTQRVDEPEGGLTQRVDETDINALSAGSPNALSENKQYILSGSQNPTTPNAEEPNNAGSTDSSAHGKGKVDPPPYKEIIDYLNEKAGTDFKPTIKVTQRYIRARWNEGFRLEDFKKVINKKVRQWKHKPDMVEYLRPTTLFGTKFEAYLMAAQHKTGWEIE